MFSGTIPGRAGAEARVRGGYYRHQRAEIEILFLGKKQADEFDYKLR